MNYYHSALSNSSKTRFTLLDLQMVLAIAAILFGFLYPAIRQIQSYLS